MSISQLERSVEMQDERVTSVAMTHANFVVDGTEAQRLWSSQPLSSRLHILAKARHSLAAKTDALCAAVPASLARNAADTLCAEIIPLLAACKFLEQQAAEVLRVRRPGRKGLPMWLTGIQTEVHRVALGRVLVIAPSNYPLFLAGAQVLQALAAGNAVMWKPGTGGRKIATLVAETMYEAGLPRELLIVAEESIEAAQAAIKQGVDKVFFTGSAPSGRLLLSQLAETLTPCVAELSGCDSVLVLPSADLSHVVKALAFGMRLNGSATCMAPRRVIMIGTNAAGRAKELVGQLSTAFRSIDGIVLKDNVQNQLESLLHDAIVTGAHVHGELEREQRPLLVEGVALEMRIAQADIFAPLLMIFEARDVTRAVAINEACPYALTASIFGDEAEARSIADRLVAGTVLINDLMIPAADPRTPFGGRKQSGFGVTQGAEGLLEMTAPKSIVVRRGSSTRNYDATTEAHRQLFEGVVQATHAAAWTQRLGGFRKMIVSASRIGEKK